MSKSAHKRLGEVLLEAQLVTAQQIQVACTDQKQFEHLRIGEILALRGWISQKTANFFAEQWPQVIVSQEKKPLGYYLEQAGLLSREQIETLLQDQQQMQTTYRLGKLAVIKGWLKQGTIDFFLQNVYTSSQNPVLSLSSTYEIVKKYVDGQKNFRNAALSKAKLNSVVLKNIDLSGSNLEEAELEKSNLSRSNLTDVNLKEARLNKAILKEANLEKALLQNANLQQASLEKANLTNADLRGANLSGAFLVQARLQGANLTGAKLDRAFLNGAVFDQHTKFDLQFNPTGVGMRLDTND